MIHSVSAKNFFSIGDEVTLDFVVNAHAPQSDAYFMTPSGARLSKVAVVIGANASGKTTVLKIIPFLKWLIVDSFDTPPNMPIVVWPFMSSNFKAKAIELSVIFEIDANVYSYSFKIHNSRIISEELHLTSKVVEKKSSKKIFSREWNETTKHYDFDSGNSEFPKSFENLLRGNASVVAVASRLNNTLSQEIGEFWQKLETNVVAQGWIGGSSGIDTFFLDSLNFFHQNEHLKKKAEKLLTEFDLGLKSLEIEKKDMGNGLQNIKIKFSHLFDDGQSEFPLELESTGTRRLFTVLKHVLRVLEVGGILILDEFDASLHPDMTLFLFDLFIDPTWNVKNAQILFSTHNHQILNKMDKYQIFLTEKNELGMTEAWRLDEMEGVRSDDNYYSKYVAGAYGAVPKI